MFKAHAIRLLFYCDLKPNTSDLLGSGDPSFLESVDIYFDKAAAIASTTPDILAQIKVIQLNDSVGRYKLLFRHKKK
jgi:hypothetical protein